ncbi:MAG: CcoQ/FixQ family Cbb3-type cytochrome c oxidase assembly chaperone [Herminiimonas sp.]|jgi:cytochrome c oxidase cbb3-type subunit 4|nr:CcoQ/FixQ family Cbb3-type cytochrome c oxidase assembly chaperone [Herminiimonas sp.]
MANPTSLIDASSAMTVVSLVTFLGILWWTFWHKGSADFDTAAYLPFADETSDADDAVTPAMEKHHG